MLADPRILPHGGPTPPDAKSYVNMFGMRECISKMSRDEKGKNNRCVSHKGVMLVPALPNDFHFPHLDPNSPVDKLLSCLIQKPLRWPLRQPAEANGTTATKYC